MELRKKSNEYVKLSASVNNRVFNANQSRKNLERTLRFALIVEFWMEQGDTEKARGAINDLKKVIQSSLS